MSPSAWRRVFVLVAGLILIGLGILGWLFMRTPKLPPSPFWGVASLLDGMSKGEAPKSTNPVEQLTNDIAEFDKATNLSPDETAKQWMALYDRALALKPRPDFLDRNLIVSVRGSFLYYIPGPAAWPAMEKLVEQRAVESGADPKNELLLRFLVHTLNNEEPKQWQDLAALYQAEMAAPPPALGADNPQNLSKSAWLSLGEDLCQVATDGKAVGDFWDKALARMEPPPAPTPTAPPDPNAPPVPPPIRTFYSPANKLRLPDLVSLVGDDEATALLKRALVLPNAEITIPRGSATQSLARQLALGLVETIQHPPWDLTNSQDGVPLFEALTKKFGAPNTACTGTMFEKYALIEQGQFNQAQRLRVIIGDSGVMNEVDSVAQAYLYAGNHGPQLFDFYKSQVVQGQDEWTNFLDVAGKLGRTDEALKTLDEVQANAELPEAARNLAWIHRYQALLANDQVDAGLAELKKCRDLPATTHDPGDTYPYYWKIETRISMSISAARIALLTERPRADFDENMKLTVSLFQDAAGTKENLTAQEQSDLGDTIDLLIQTNHTRDAEGLLHLLIEVEVGRNRAKLDQGDSDLILDREIRLLTTYYYEGQDWDDVLAMFRDFPYWHESDLAGMNYDQGKIGSVSYPLQLIAARSLAKKGRTAEAAPLLDEVLQIFRADDKAYSFLLDLNPDPIPKLDALYAEDRFEKRPLIWKAVVLFKQGKLDDAEKVCRQAIAIDPSDGAAGKIDRMRAYGVLEEILRQKGQADEAAKMQKILDAIRMSEQADDLYNAWLFTRAAKLYEQALGVFSDAYCIESRLAKRLTDLGKIDEAAVHYRRAFELMPDSFGRMESHCFGCEGIFEGSVAQDTAEKTFTDLMAKNPAKAQVPYLLGKLRLEQGRTQEAVALFKKATDLDPDYINAWTELTKLDRVEVLPPALVDAAQLAKIRLDPQFAHGFPDPSRVRDLAQLWQAKAAADKLHVPRFPPRLFPLEASRALLEKTLIPKVKMNVGTSNFDFHLNGAMWPLTDPQPDANLVLDRNDLIGTLRAEWRESYGN